MRKLTASYFSTKQANATALLVWYRNTPRTTIQLFAKIKVKSWGYFFFFFF
jgi:hypothetical protein